MTTSLAQKLLASTVNCSIVLMLSLPFCDLWPTNWKAISVLICFAYHMLFRRRCAGLVVARAYNRSPASTLYVALYSLGWSTVLYSVIVPFDLLVCYGTVQALCVKLTGNPLPAWLTGSQTVCRSTTTTTKENGACRDDVATGRSRALEPRAVWSRCVGLVCRARPDRDLVPVLCVEERS
jgi:hypothetical protein